MIIIPTAARPIDVKQYFVQLLLEWRLLKIFLALAGDRTVDRWAAITAFSLLGSHLSAVVHSRYSALWDHNELFDLSSSRFLVLCSFRFLIIAGGPLPIASIHVGFMHEADMADCCSSIFVARQSPLSPAGTCTVRHSTHIFIFSKTRNHTYISGVQGIIRKANNQNHSGE